MLKKGGKTLCRCVITQSSVVDQVVGCQALVAGQISGRRSRPHAKSALNISTGQIPTEESFDFNIEKPLSLGLREAIELLSDIPTDQDLPHSLFVITWA